MHFFVVYLTTTRLFGQTSLAGHTRPFSMHPLCTYLFIHPSSLYPLHRRAAGLILEATKEEEKREIIEVQKEGG